MQHVIHECRRCGGAIYPEDHVEVPHDEYLEVLERCQHCDYGIEMHKYDGGSPYVMDYQASTEPINYGRFVQRLIDARNAIGCNLVEAA